MEEVELGGLDDGEQDAPVFASAEDDEYHLFDRGEVRFCFADSAACLESKLLCGDPSAFVCIHGSLFIP